MMVDTSHPHPKVAGVVRQDVSQSSGSLTGRDMRETDRLLARTCSVPRSAGCPLTYSSITGTGEGEGGAEECIDLPLVPLGAGRVRQGPRGLRGARDGRWGAGRGVRRLLFQRAVLANVVVAPEGSLC